MTSLPEFGTLLPPPMRLCLECFCYLLVCLLAALQKKKKKKKKKKTIGQFSSNVVEECRTGRREPFHFGANPDHVRHAQFIFSLTLQDQVSSV